MKCKWCKKEFSSSYGRVYCSDACKYAAKYPPRAGGIVGFGRTCATCGKTYDGQRHKYCSDSCFAVSCVNSKKRVKGAAKAARQKIIFDKKDVPCMDCGVTYPQGVMDLHHRDPSEKDFTISSYNRADIPALIRELEKCDAICSNCHRLRHINEGSRLTDSP